MKGIHVQVTNWVLASSESVLKSDESTQQFKLRQSRYWGRPGSRGEFSANFLKTRTVSRQLKI